MASAIESVYYIKVEESEGKDFTCDIDSLLLKNQSNLKKSISTTNNQTNNTILTKCNGGNSTWETMKAKFF